MATDEEILEDAKKRLDGAREEFEKARIEYDKVTGVVYRWEEAIENLKREKDYYDRVCESINSQKQNDNSKVD